MFVNEKIAWFRCGVFCGNQPARFVGMETWFRGHFFLQDFRISYRCYKNFRQSLSTGSIDYLVHLELSLLSLLCRRGSSNRAWKSPSHSKENLFRRWNGRDVFLLTWYLHTSTVASWKVGFLIFYSVILGLVNYDLTFNRFEDGTANFLAILSIKHGLNFIRNHLDSMENVSVHTFHVAQWLFNSLTELKHANGRDLVEIYCNSNFTDRSRQGAIVTFNLKDENGCYIGYAQVY